MYVRCQGSTGCYTWLYKHTESDFDKRARAAGVLSSRRMDTEADLYYTWDDTSRVLNAAMADRTRYTVCSNKAACLGNATAVEVNAEAVMPTIDRTIKPNDASAGSLVFRAPPQSSANGSGLWMEPFQFGDRPPPWLHIAPGSVSGNTVWIQYKIRFNSQQISGSGESCSGGCAGPKTTPLYGNSPKGSDSSTIEITSVLDFRSGARGRGIQAMYGQQGIDASYGVQQAVKCSGSPFRNCFKFQPDTWHTITTKVTVNAPPRYAGSGGAGCRSSPQPTSRVEGWINTTKVHDNPCASINYGSSDGDGLGSLEFTSDHTRRTPTDHPEGRMWIADVIVSTSAIALSDAPL